MNTHTHPVCETINKKPPKKCQDVQRLSILFRLPIMGFPWRCQLSYPILAFTQRLSTVKYPAMNTSISIDSCSCRNQQTQEALRMTITVVLTQGTQPK